MPYEFKQRLFIIFWIIYIIQSFHPSLEYSCPGAAGTPGGTLRVLSMERRLDFNQSVRKQSWTSIEMQDREGYRNGYNIVYLFTSSFLLSLFGSCWLFSVLIGSCCQFYEGSCFSSCLVMLLLAFLVGSSSRCLPLMYKMSDIVMFLFRCWVMTPPTSYSWAPPPSSSSPSAPPSSSTALAACCTPSSPLCRPPPRGAALPGSSGYGTN